MQLKTLSRLIAQFRDAGSNQNRVRRIRRRAATQGRDVRLQVADAISGGLLEELESRALLAGDPITANLTSGSLVISDLVGGNDSLQLTRSGSDLVITVGAGSTIGTNAGTGDGTNSVAIPIASITAGVTVDAGNGNDSVTLDFTGDINFPVGVTIVDGAGTDAVHLNSDITFASSSSLAVTAESVTTAAGVDLTTSATGAITFTADNMALNPTGTLVTPNTLTLRQKSNGMPINLGDPVFDTFTGADGSSVDSTIWQPAIGGSFALPTIQNNQARLFQRQPLNTKAQFKPGVDGTITVTGQITPLASNNSDNLIVLTRSNGNTAGGSNTPSQGIGGFVQVGGGVQIYSAGVSVTGATTSSLSYTTGSTYSFSLTDTGTAITFTITEIANPSNTATVTATTATTSFPTNYVTFENREFTGFVTLLDNVNISNGVTTSSLGLSDAELDTIAASSIQIGDTNSGAITVNSVITSNTNLSLTTGSSGIVSNRGSLGTTGSTITLNTTGTIGTSSSRIQFADNTNTAQQNVVIGSTNQASSVYLDGLGSLTLGSISGSTANTTIDVTARTNLVVAASATINSGTSSNSLGADLTSASAGDNGTGTLTVNANANVVGANINLRGADQEINSTANVGSTGSSTLASVGLNYGAIFYNGNLYVPDQNGNRVLKITPAGSTTIYATGVSSPRDVAFDSVGNMYVANFAGGASTVSIVAPGGGTGTLFASGFNGAWGLTLDGSDNVYVVNSSGTTISKVTVSAPGVFSSVNHSFSTVSSGTFTVRYFADGNLYAGGGLTGGIVKISPTTGIVTPFVSAAGGFYFGLTYDSATGNLYATRNDDTVKLVTPAGTVTTFATGFGQPVGLARDSSGNLYVGNINSSSVIKIAPGATSQVTVRGSILSRPMSLGGINTAVAGINLTDTELGRISTTSTGTITFGDTAQTGDITFTTATTATTAGASTTVIQSTTGAGKIVLDDGANTGTALNGNGGVISLTAGTGGITATAANNTSAEISTTAATVTMNTTGPIGTSANRIQFADNTTTTQQNVVIGSINQASSVYLDGLGSLTLGSISGGTANTTIDVTARTNLVVAAGATIISGTSSNSLGADLKADGSGDEGTGTLTIGAGSNVYGATINLRGADEAIDSTAKVGSAGIPAVTTYTSSISSQPRGIAFDSSGNLYAITWGTGILYRVAPGGGSVTTIASGFVSAQGVAVDSSGNVYVCDVNGNVFKNPVGAGAKTPFVTGLGILYNMVVKGGDLYVTNYSGVKKITNLAGTPIVSDYATGAASASGLAFDSSGNLFISTEGGNLYKVAANATIPAAATLINSGLNSEALAIDASDNLYLSTFGSTIRKLAPSGTGTATSIATGLNLTFGLAVDASGNVYVSDNGGNSIVKVTATIVATNQLTVRSSQPSRPIALGGGTAVAGINLSDAELGRMVTSSGGTVTIGDTAQTGDITFTTATTATTAGAATTVIQSTGGAGKIVLDDGANTGTALNGNGGVISLTAGTGGITATAANNTSAEISTTGATVTMNTTGPIGTSANRIQFANNTNTAQQNVVIGSTNQASSVFLGGVGSLTLGAINDSTRNAAIDVTAGNQLVVTAAISTLGGNINFAAANGVSLTGAAAAVSTVGGSTATLSQAGSDLTTNDAWRTSGVVKTRDADGDNIYGTAGYYLYGGASSQPTLVPSFATVAVAAGTVQYGPDVGYVRLDDPALTGVGPVANVSTGTRYRASQAANQEGDLVVITITQAGSFRLGVIQDNHDLTAVSPLSLRVRQTTGGSADSGYLSATAERNLDGDYFFFDFINAQVGSVYTLSGVNDGGFPSNGIYGVTFDKIQGGTYTVNADTDNDGGGAYIQNNAGSTAATGGGNVSITAADATLLGTTNAGGGRVTIVPTNSRQIDLGTNAANKLGLTDTELDGITAGTIQVGDTNSGAITLSAAITSNTNLALTTGANGVISTGGSLGTTGATVTLNTTGPIGTAANRIQFADNTNTTQQNVVIGSTNQASNVYLDGLGSLTLGNISGGTANTTIDVTTRANLVVAASATINSGTSSVSLGADMTAAGAGDNSVGTLSIGSGASVFAASMTMRGADVDIAGTANVGMAIASSTTTISNVISTGLNSPRGAAFDSAGNLYVANQSGAITKVTFSSPGVVNQVVTNFATVGALPDGLVFDAAGNMYSANGAGTISKITFSSPGVLGTVNNSFISTGLNAPVALVFDSTGNLFIANYGNGKISKATFTSPGVFGTLSDFADLTSLGVTGAGSITIDPSNNLYVASNSKIVKVTPAGAASVIVASGIANDFTIAYFQGTLLAARSTTTLGQYSTSGTLLNASYATSLNTTWQTAPDSQGNLWVVNTGANSVSKVVPNPTLTQLSLRPSVSSLPMSIGGTNNAVTGINLTDSELARIFSTSAGSIIFGDSSQTGDITFTTATVATTASASTTVIQSASGAGKIVLDNSAGNGSALNGNSGNVSLTAGTGGIVEASTNTTAATDIVNAATTSLVSAGAIGTAILPVQIGATNLNTNSSTNNSNQFLRATGAVTIDATGVSAGTGTVTLVGGTVSLGGSNRIADTTKLTVNGGTLAIGGFSDAVSTVTLKSGSITGSGGSLTSTNTIQTESGSVSAILAGSNGLTQSTAGTTTLSGANTFTGITTLSAGTLALSGASTNNIASTTSIDVQSGATLNVTGLTSGTLVLANGQTLKGQGTVTGKTTAANGSIVALGASPGILNTGDITFNSGSTFSVELNGTSVGSLYDQLNVTGTVTINDGNLNLSLGYVPANGDSFVIVNNDSTDPVTVTNPFKIGGSPVPEGGSFILGGNRFVLTYAGGTNNNDVVLTVQNNTAPTAVVLSPSSASLAEDVSTAADTLLSTIAITDDGSGTNTLSLSGSDAASFRIVGDQLFLKAGVVLDFETKSSYSVRVNVDDTTVGGTPDAFVDFTLTITDVNEAPTAVVLTPGSASLAEDVSTSSFTILSTISITDDALGTNVLSLSGADAASFEIVEGKLRLKAGVVLDFETKSSYTVRVNIDDTSVGGTPDAFADFVLSITDVAEDTTRPSSSVNALPLNAASLSIPITVTGFDPTGIEGPASGVKEYDLYVATAGGTFSKFATVSASSPTTVFTASSNQVYYFRSIARDNAGNEELDNGADAFIRVGDFDKPVSLVTSAVANSAGLFTITATGSDTGGGRVSRFDIYVSVDGGSATLVGSANAISNSGTLTYSGIVDNASHTYRFTSRAVDTAGNTEDAHTAADVTTTATFAAPASFQGTGIDVQLGATQRSYVRYVDVLFNDATGVSALTQANRVQVEKFGLTSADVTAGTGATVPFAVVQIGSSNRLRLDFGVQGVGGARNSTAGDGFYRVRVDANGDSDYNDAGESFEFFRLLGDANGNAVIDALDTTVVDNLFGQIGTNLEGDLNGDGVVNTADKNFTLSRNRGRKLRDEWKSLLDD